MSTLDLLGRLTSFPTVSREPNIHLIEFVREYLAERSIVSELTLAENGSKANLFATIGPPDIPGVLLSGHTDVVPVEGQPWSSDPFKLRLQQGRAYGRGTADMKGFLASVLSFADRASRARLATPVHLAFSHDEEIGCVGVRSLIERLEGRHVLPRFGIVGEPTNLRIAVGHKGKIGARATCCGVEGHSALAPKALNAIHLACDFIGELRRRQDVLEVDGARDPAYDVPYTTIHAGKISGGTALNIVPNACTVDFEIRNVASDDAGALLNSLMDSAAELANRHRKRFPSADIRIEVFNAYPGLATEVDDEVVTFAKGLVDDQDLMKVAFGTEGGMFSDQLGIPMVVCGPGSMDQGHKADEFISLDQLDACDRMLDRLLAKLAE